MNQIKGSQETRQVEPGCAETKSHGRKRSRSSRSENRLKTKKKRRAADNGLEEYVRELTRRDLVGLKKSVPWLKRLPL